MEELLPITHSKYELKYPYSLTKDGKVYSHFSHKFLSTQLDKNGYEKVQLISTDNKRHRYSVHRLMLENFCPREDMAELQVNHKDGNKLNNHLDNLEWCTGSENIKHAFAIGLKTQRGEHNNLAKLTENDVIYIIELLLSKKYISRAIAAEYSVDEQTIGNIRQHLTWTYLTEGIDFS